MVHVMQAGIEGCIFIHASGFIGGHATKEGAIAMAIKVSCALLYMHCAENEDNVGVFSCTAATPSHSCTCVLFRRCR
jgi:hypothetical protein